METFVIVVASIILCILIIVLVYIKITEKKSEQETKREKEQENHDRLKRWVWGSFSVDLGTIQEIGTQNEIVRIVNFLAHETAVLCVKQDQKHREGGLHAGYWDNDVSSAKGKWSGAKKLALQIAPELADRLPHFSEFEPLKSYNAEHLIQKKANQLVA